ncbi:hypothetical protein Tco_0374012 [Tanacetum coccineum]
MMTVKYCPRGEIKKLEIELWNLKLRKYIGGLPDMIRANVMSYRPQTMKEAIEGTNNKTRGRTLGGLTLLGLVKRESTRDHCPCVQNATITTKGHVMHMVFLNARWSAIWARDCRQFIVPLMVILNNWGTPEQLKCWNLRMSVVFQGAFQEGDYPRTTGLQRRYGFDVIVGMEWVGQSTMLSLIVPRRFTVRIPWGNETLIIHGDGSNQGNGTRLNIISCTKTHKYLLKGHHVFLAHVTTKEIEDKSGEKRIEDVPIVRDFLEHEHHIALAPSEMKDLSKQSARVYLTRVIRPSSSPWGALRYDQEGFNEGEIGASTADGTLCLNKAELVADVMSYAQSFTLERGRTFWQTGKLNPRYVGPFKVLEKVGSIAYKLELPQELGRIHNTLHVSNLKKCYSDEPLAVPLEGLHIDDKIQFMEEPVEIIEREIND